MRRFCVYMVLLLSACATSKEIQGPNGKPAHLIKCGSAHIDACYEKAAEVCPKGYVFLDKDGNPNSIITPTFGGGFLAVRGPSSMFVECKTP